jgi:hypothetical protein
MVSALTCIAKWFRGVAGMAALGMGVTGLLGASSISARAQEPTTVERTAKGATAKSIEVGLYLNVKPDCTTGTLPAIRLVEAPANGTVIIKQAKVRATNYKQCLALEVPGFIAFYQSKPDFSGVDKVVIEVKYPEGRTELQRITVNVGTGPGGQKI